MMEYRRNHTNIDWAKVEEQEREGVYDGQGRPLTGAEQAERLHLLSKAARLEQHPLPTGADGGAEFVAKCRDREDLIKSMRKELNPYE